MDQFIAYNFFKSGLISVGKSIDSIQRSLTSTLSECVYYQPSVILLDDLDAIAGKTEQEISDPSYFNRYDLKCFDDYIISLHILMFSLSEGYKIYIAYYFLKQIKLSWY